jgi:hypothetical protein
MPAHKHPKKKFHSPYFANLRDTEEDLILRYGASITDDLWFLGRSAAAQEIERRQREIAALRSLRRTGRVFRVTADAS